MQTLREFLADQSEQTVGLLHPSSDSYSGELVAAHCLSDNDGLLTCQAVVAWVESYVSEHPDVQRVKQKQYGPLVVCYREGDTDTKISVSQGSRDTIDIIVTEEPVRPQ